MRRRARAGEVMFVNQLHVTLEGEQVSDNGVPVDGFVAALKGVQDAMRLMVEHLAGQDKRPGRRPNWIRKESALRVVSARRGSLVAELALDSPPHNENPTHAYGKRAFESLRNWDGGENSTLPREVADRIFAIPQKLPENVHLWLGDEELPRRVRIKRPVKIRKRTEIPQEAVLYGWLKAVDWSRHKAQLHPYCDSPVQLRFGPGLDEDMVRFATQYVKVRGRGRFNKNDEWQYVQVERIGRADDWGKPFDAEALLNNPNPRIFRSDDVLRASEPFDVDEFIRIIHEGRDV